MKSDLMTLLLTVDLAVTCSVQKHLSQGRQPCCLLPVMFKEAEVRFDSLQHYTYSVQRQGGQRQ